MTDTPTPEQVEAMVRRAQLRDPCAPARDVSELVEYLAALQARVRELEAAMNHICMKCNSGKDGALEAPWVCT